MKATIGSVIVEGTPKEIAELARELGAHLTKLEERAVPASRVGSDARVTENRGGRSDHPTTEELVAQIKAVDQASVDALVEANPSARPNDFLTAILGINPSGLLRGRRNEIYTRAYNRIAASRKKLKIASPTAQRVAA